MCSWKNQPSTELNAVDDIVRFVFQKGCLGFVWEIDCCVTGNLGETVALVQATNDDGFNQDNSGG